MADKKIGKSKFVIYSSSEDTVSDNVGSSDVNTEDLEKTNIMMHPSMYKPIQRLKLSPEFKNISRKLIVESLMKQPNEDAGKDIVVDVGSDTEDIELTFDEISNKRLSAKKLVYTLPRDEYRPDKDDLSPKTRMYLSRPGG